MDGRKNGRINRRLAGPPQPIGEAVPADGNAYRACHPASLKVQAKDAERSLKTCRPMDASVCSAGAVILIVIGWGEER